MKATLLLIPFALISLLSSCSQEEKVTTTKLSLISGALTSGGVPILNGGVMIYGMKADGSTSFAIKGNNEGEDIALNLSNGVWNFYTIGWTGVDNANNPTGPLTGTTKCGKALALELKGTEIAVNFNVTASSCSDPVFSSGHIGKDYAGIPISGTFAPLKLSSCMELVSNIDTKAPVSYANDCAPSKGLMRSFKVIFPDYLPSHPNNIVPNQNLSSSCITIGELPTPTIIDTVQIPYGNGVFPLFTIIRGYYDNNCTESLGTENHLFPKGLGAIPAGLAERQIYFGQEGYTEKGSLYLRSNKVQYCASPAGAILPTQQEGVLGITPSSAADPIRVCTAAQFYDLAGITFLQSGIRLLANINLFTINANSTVNKPPLFEMIGNECNTSTCSSSGAFTGIFDGGGHKISGLTIEKEFTSGSAPMWIGMFRRIGIGATVRDLRLVLPEIRASHSSVSPTYVGTIAGENLGTLKNITILHGNVEAKDGSYVGGAVGKISDSSASLRNIKIKEGHIEGGNSVGGLAGGSYGSNSGTPFISQSLFEGEINAHASVGTSVGVGGIIGTTTSGGNTILNEVAFHGKISGGQKMGGLVGSMDAGTIINSYATGSIQSYSQTTPETGGLVGYFGPSAIISKSFFAHGALRGLPSGVGAITGTPFGSGGSCTNGTFSAAQLSSPLTDCGNQISIANETVLHTQTTYASYYLDPIWKFDDNGYDIPRLAFEEIRPCSGKYANRLGSGTLTDPWTICNATQFKMITNAPQAHYKILSDINFGWEPTATASIINTPFTGSLDGNNKSISGIRINLTSLEILFPVGIFRSTSVGSQINNLTIDGVSLSNTSGFATSEIPIGGLVGINSGLLNNVRVSGSVDDFAADPDLVIGGIAGKNTGSILASSAEISPTGSNNIGNITGINAGLIKWSRTYSSISVTPAYGNNFGGIAGRNLSTGQIHESYSKGYLMISPGSEATNIGGLVGLNEGLIKNSYATTNFSGTLTPHPITTDLCTIGTTPYMSYFNLFTDYISSEFECNSYGGMWLPINSLIPKNHHVGGLVGQHFAGSIEKSYGSFKFMTSPTLFHLPSMGGLIGTKFAGIVDVFQLEYINNIAPNRQPTPATVVTSGPFPDLIDYQNMNFHISDNEFPYGTDPSLLPIWEYKDGIPELRRTEEIDSYPMSYYIGLIQAP